MRYLIALAFVLGGCATGTDPGGGGDDDDGPPADARITDTPDAEDVEPLDAGPPDGTPLPDEVTAQEYLCNDGFDNDSNGQTDCADARCTFACSALMTACTAPNQLRAYAMAPLPAAIPDLSSVTASVAVAQTGTVVLAAIRFNASHAFTGDIDLTVTSPTATTLDLSSDNGSLSPAGYVNTVLIDSAATSIADGTAPFTGNFRPEQAFSGVTGQTITGTWTSRVTDDYAADVGNWTELALALCADPP